MRTSWLNECILRNTDQKILFQTPSFIHFLSNFRAELKLYSDQSLQSRMALYLWWLQGGWKDYKEVDWQVSSKSISFASNILLGELNIFRPLPLYLILIYKERQNLQNIYDISNPAGLNGFIHWWSTHGINEYPNIKSTPFIDDILPDELNVFKPLPLYLILIYKVRQDLQNIYNLNNPKGINGLIHWWSNHGVNEYPYIVNLIKNKPLNKKSTPTPPDLSHGVNIIGYIQGMLGLGEDARLAGKVIHGLNINSVFINAPIAGPDKIIKPTIDIPIVEETRHDISLFCLPPTEMMRLALEGRQILINGPEYKIGAWPWELPHWPTAFSKVRTFVDEIWAQSEYVKQCFMKEGNTPVYKMPMAVTLPAPSKNIRSQLLRVPEETFLFYLMFDGNSWLSRKNPLAGVLAFQKAFMNEKKNVDVGLIIKAMNVNQSDPTWQEIETIAQNDSRIQIIDKRMSRQDVVNLMSSCDCYISLHRSEGFGRVIAEAMLLGQPVVTTNFSGNVDFCKKDTAFLVNGELIPLQSGDYIFTEGQYWCNPSINEAASQLIKLYNEPLLRSKIALAGKHLIEKNYSIEAVSKAYADRLQKIKNNLN